MINDPYIPNKANELNSALKSINAPFYVVCSTLKDKANKEYQKMSWRKLSPNCDPNYINATYISEKVVDLRLKKIFGISLNELTKASGKAIQKATKFIHEQREKLQKKLPSGKQNISMPFPPETTVVKACNSLSCVVNDVLLALGEKSVTATEDKRKIIFLKSGKPISKKLVNIKGVKNPDNVIYAADKVKRSKYNGQVVNIQGMNINLLDIINAKELGKVLVVGFSVRKKSTDVNCIALDDLKNRSSVLKFEWAVSGDELIGTTPGVTIQPETIAPGTEINKTFDAPDFPIPDVHNTFVSMDEFKSGAKGLTKKQRFAGQKEIEYINSLKRKKPTTGSTKGSPKKPKLDKPKYPVIDVDNTYVSVDEVNEAAKKLNKRVPEDINVVGIPPVVEPNNIDYGAVAKSIDDLKNLLLSARKK